MNISQIRKELMEIRTELLILTGRIAKIQIDIDGTQAQIDVDQAVDSLKKGN